MTSDRLVYVVVSEDEYGGLWKRDNTTCEYCDNKRFVPKVFDEKHDAEEYAERYMNSYVNKKCCDYEIHISEVVPMMRGDDDADSLFVTVSSAPYGGALQRQCTECNGTEFSMKLFTNERDAEKYVDHYVRHVAQPCKSCMYNHDIKIINV